MTGRALPLPLPMTLLALGALACGQGAALVCNSDLDCDNGDVCFDGRCDVPPDVEAAPPPAPVCPLPNVSPAPGAVEVELLDSVRAQVADEDPRGVVFSLQLDGAPVAARQLTDGPDVVLVPLAPLQPEQLYTVLLTHACGEQAWTFTTQKVMVGPVVEPPVIGWNFQNAEATPRSAAGLLGFVAPGFAALRLDVTVAELSFLRDNGEQNPCHPTLPMVGAREGARWAYAMEGNAFPSASGLTSLTVRGVSKGTGIEISAFAIIDARLLEDHAAPGCTPGDDACALQDCVAAAGFGLRCEPCADGLPVCISYAVRAMAAPLDAAPDNRSYETVCADARCSDDALCL